MRFYKKAGLEGLEQLQYSTQKTASSDNGGAKSGASADLLLQKVIQAWPNLTESQLQTIANVIARRRSGARSLPPTASQSTAKPKAATPSQTSNPKENQS